MRNYQVFVGLAGVAAIVAGAALMTTSCSEDDPVDPGTAGSGGTGVDAGGPEAAVSDEAAAGSAGTGDDGGAVGQDEGGDAATPTADAAACAARTTVTVTADIIAATTWTACNIYVLPPQTSLFVKGGATLTIEPGTIVQGQAGSRLVITRGSKLIAEGTKEKPIVLTTNQADGAKTAGYWGGLLVLGAAPINNNKLSSPPSNEATFEAFTAGTPEGLFGGTDTHDSSGVIKYVRVEFAGFSYLPDREFNNVTLCGVGDGTTIDYLQVHGGSDDGIEFFGGTVNVKHVVSSQNQDDGFDTDNGWEGKAQFVIVQNIDPHGTTEASNGYESDNHGTAASYTAEPRTLPTVYNVTSLGKKDYADGNSFAAVLRRGTGGKYWNHIIAGFPKGIELRDQATADQVTAGNLFIKNSIIFNGADGLTWPAATATGDIDEKTIFENADWANREVDPGLPAEAYSRTAPSFKPAAGSPALTGGATPPADGFFDPTATFVGAVGADDWTAGWTAYPQPLVAQ